MVPAVCDGPADVGDSVRHILGVEKGGAAWGVAERTPASPGRANAAAPSRARGCR